MRWYWIDRFTEFVSGEYAVAQKCVSMGEDHLHGYQGSYLMLPQPLVVEGIAQTGGLLAGEATGFTAKLVLAKISRAQFHFAARPGDTLRYRAEIESRSAEGVRIVGTSHVGDRLQAQVELFLAALGEKFGGQQMFSAADFCRLLSILRIYEIGRTSDGKPLTPPDGVREMEPLAR